MINIFFHNMPDDTRYTFAVSKIRALESKMLDHSNIIRLLKSNGTDEMLKILLDTEYNKSLNEAEGGSFEKALDNALLNNYRLINSIDPDPQWTDMWRWRFDAHNIKVILKSRHLKNDYPEFLIPYGTIEPKRLLNAFEKGNLAILPDQLREAVEALSQPEGQAQKDASGIDLVIDKAVYTFISSEARRSKNLFIIHLAEMIIDFINIRAYLRIKKLDISIDLFNKAFIPGGKIKKDAFLTDSKEADETVRSIIDKTPYTILKTSIDSNKIALLETSMDNFLINYLRQTRQRVFGVEPLIGFIFGKEFEIKNLQNIYIGKENMIGESEIRERLRESYV